MRARLRIPTPEQIAKLNDRLLPDLGRGKGAHADGHKPEPDDRGRYRNEAQRDRDRIMYSSAFQRLGGVTQVTESELGFTFHTRLTHSLKVAQVTRRAVELLLQEADDPDGHVVGDAVALVKTLNPDAAEASALAHDLGHPPFGHVAEAVLDRLSREAGGEGFQGNAQSFRIVTRLAIRAEAIGLSLTRRTLDGSLKYPWPRDLNDPAHHDKWGAYSDDIEPFEWVRQGSELHQLSLTARLMDWGDDLTYAVHDLDDYYRAGLVPLDRLAAGGAEVDRFREGLRAMGIEDPEPDVSAVMDVLRPFPLTDPYEGRDDQRAGLRDFGSTLITLYLDAIRVEETNDPGHADFVIKDEPEAQVRALKRLTRAYVVMHPALAVQQRGRRNIIESLFEWYLDATDPKGDPREERRLIPATYRARLDDAHTDPERVRIVTDIIAGLTENSAHALFRRMSGIDPGTLLDAAARVP
jgi:dGTPase